MKLVRRAALCVASFVVFATAAAGQALASSGVVISQIYGAGGNAGATFRNDYVELFNRSATPVSLAGWSVQYASAAGSGNFGGNPVTALGGTLAPGQYHLVQLASSGANGVVLPTPDSTGTVNAAAGPARSRSSTRLRGWPATAAQRRARSRN